MSSTPRIRSAYVALPGLGEAWVEQGGTTRGRNFFDTDRNLRRVDLSSGITLFAGRWSVVLDAPRPLATAWARWIWFGMAAPLLTIAAVTGSMLPRRA
jgi:hypothetical protein